MDKERPKQLFLVLLGVLLAASSLWVLSVRRTPTPAPAAALSAPLPAPTREIPLITLAKQHSAMRGPRADADGKVDIEICGRGSERIDPADEEAYAKLGKALQAKPLQRWLKALAQSSDQRAQAAGLMLAIISSEAAEQQMQLREKLVDRALRSSDPAIYALALGACALAGGASRCDELDPREWAQLDPGNGAPYLLMANAAFSRQDSAAQAAAIAQLANAKTYDTYRERLIGFAAPALPQDLKPAERAALGALAASWLTLGVAPAFPLVSYCRSQAAQAAQQCTAIADLLSQHATTVIESRIAAGLGQAAGWAPGRVALMRQHDDALNGMNTSAQWLLDPLQSFSCASVQAANAYFDALVQGGEVPLLEQRLLQSGLSDAEAAGQYRQFLKTLQGRIEPLARREP